MYMREVKFRVFDKEKKTLLDYGDFYLDSVGRVFTTKYSGYGEPHTDISELVELSQFTGLKDKNGEKIYESDIVKLSKYDMCDGVSCCIKYVSNSGDKLKVVYFDNGRFLVNPHGPDNSVEVIGNIYANNDLLL